MQSKLINKNYTYTKELKLEAVKLFLEGKSTKYICEHLNINDLRRVNVWVNLYREKGELAFVDGRGKKATGRPKT